MTNQYTPGPWVINDNQEDCGDTKLSVETVEQYFIAQVDEGAQQRANAYLISAAPDLLEALNDLFGADMEYCMKMDGKDDQIAAIAKARAAIAKATGAA